MSGLRTLAALSAGLCLAGCYGPSSTSLADAALGCGMSRSRPAAEAYIRGLGPRSLSETLTGRRHVGAQPIHGWLTVYAAQGAEGCRLQGRAADIWELLQTVPAVPGASRWRMTAGFDADDYVTLERFGRRGEGHQVRVWLPRGDMVRLRRAILASSGAPLEEDHWSGFLARPGRFRLEAVTRRLDPAPPP